MNNITPVFAASGVEFLVVLLLVAASAIYNWLQKKKNGEDDWSEVEKPRPTPPKPSAPTSSWEEELRRILEGQTPHTPPVKPPPVPAPARPGPPAAPRKQPTPPRIPTPVVSTPRPNRTYRGHCEHCAGHIEFPSNMMGEDIKCPHCYRQTRLNPFTETRVEQLAHPPATTASSRIPTATTHDAERPAIPQPGNQHAHHSRTAERSGEVKEVLNLFTNPQTARQAIIASVILGPPKSLEQ